MKCSEILEPANGKYTFDSTGATNRGEDFWVKFNEITRIRVIEYNKFYEKTLTRAFLLHKNAISSILRYQNTLVKVYEYEIRVNPNSREVENDRG